MATPIKVVGIDGALLNFGVAVGTFYPDQNKLVIHKIEHLGYKRPTKNKVRADADHAKKVGAALKKYCRGANLVFAELPYGSRSAAAAWSLGIALGIMSTIGKDIKWVSAIRVKNYTGNKTKRAMINWAVAKYDTLPWPKHGNKVVNSAEHIADAIGVLHTGLAIK